MLGGACRALCVLVRRLQVLWQRVDESAFAGGVELVANEQQEVDDSSNPEDNQHERDGNGRL